MSVEALNWVIKQRTGDAGLQGVLFALANAADPEGVAFGWWRSKDHWWPYLMNVTQLSRAGLFKVIRRGQNIGLLSREYIAPADGSKPQMLIRLHLERVVDIRFESITETQESARPPENDSSESTSWTDEQDDNPPGRLDESTLETPSLYNPITNPTTPKPPSQAELPKAQQEGTRRTYDLTEPIGFRSWFENYLGWQTMDRTMALREYVGLSEPDRDKLANATPRYLSDCSRLRKPPKSAHLFARRRDGRALFENYGSGAMAAQAGPRLLIREGTDAYQAWCAFYAVAFGGEPKIPRHLVDPTVRGAWVNAEWPPGSSAWIVPREDWLFVEKWMPQYMAWCKRVTEVIARPPVIVRAREHHRRMRLIGTHGNDWIATHTYDGLIVPREFPPAKSSPQESQQEASLATDDDLQHFSETPVCH